MNSLLPRPDSAIQQFSFVDALVVGLYDGAFEASNVTSHGTLGVGCGDALDGELVLIDGSLFVCRADGVTAVEPSARIPFAEVVRFEPTFSQQLTGPISEAAFEALVDSLVPSHNLFYAIRVDGDFASVTVREAVKQQRPFRGLAEAVGDQHESTITATSGTLLGFKGPDVFQGLSVADYHLHYIDSDRALGGHSMDFELTSGTLTIEAYANFMLRLPQTESYLGAVLDDINADVAIRAAESQ